MFVKIWLEKVNKSVTEQGWWQSQRN